jgi:hypothetical protein
MGKVFYAEGPAGEGEPALTDARSWPDATLSFDENAHLPEKQTMTHRILSMAGASSSIDAVIG